MSSTTFFTRQLNYTKPHQKEKTYRNDQNPRQKYNPHLCLHGLGWGMRGTEVDGALGSSAHNEPALIISPGKCHNLSFSGILWENSDW
jgi:hypothetical protein